MTRFVNDPRQPAFDLTSFARILARGGEMGARIRAYDWASTSLGPIEQWPQSLQTIVSIMLTSRQPIWIGWGPELIKLYNDPYKAIVGGKHPHALGQPASVVWRDIWHDIAPMLAQVMEQNQGTYVESQLLIMERYGYPEETYYTFSYNPVLAESGEVGGMFCTNTDDSYRVISQRQLALLRALAADTSEAKTVADVCEYSEKSLERNPHDILFALLYLTDEDEDSLELAAASRIRREHAAVPAAVDLNTPTVWPFRAVMDTQVPVVVDDLRATFGDLPSGAWQRPPDRALVLPILQAGEFGKAGVLIVGLNPFRMLDDDYEGFLWLVAGQIASSLANAQAYEEERRRAQALAELDQAKTLFFSNVSHEFRTPLTLLLGPIEETLNDGDTLPANRERMQVAHRNALRLLKLVNALLDFSRIEGGRIRAAYQPTDLAAYTADLASGFRSAIERAGMTLSVNTPTLSEPVYIDTEMWEKIVLNLLSNAFKYTLQGTITVTLRQLSGHVALTVADTGVGIPEEELPHIFERFHRVPGTEGRTHEGTGIGLSLVQELVRLHGGSINVESVLGEGSSFTVTLPLGTKHLPSGQVSGNPAASATSRGQAYIEEALRWLPEHNPDEEVIRDLPLDTATHAFTGDPRAGTRKARILITDDNVDMREYIQRLLSGKYEVVAAPDGQAALDEARRQRPDLVLADVMMPRLDGFGLLQALRSDPAMRTIPVVMLSARAGEEARVEGVEAGADDYLVKPFSGRELLARIAALLELAELRTESQRAVEAERERLFTLFMQAPAIIAVLRGPQFIFELANPMYMQMVGKDREFLGKPVSEALPEVVEQGFVDLLSSVYHTGKPYFGNEISVKLDRHEDGNLEEVYLNFVYQPYRGAEGDIQGILVHAVDVTEQVRARQQVEAQNRVLEMITTGAPLAQSLEYLVVSLEEHSNDEMIGSILLLDDDRTHLRYGAAPSLPQAYNDAIDGLPIGPGIGSCGTAAYLREPVIVTDIATDPLWDDYRELALEHGLRACWSTPIFLGDEVVATFALYYRQPHYPTDADRRVIWFATRTAQLAIEHARIEERRRLVLEQEKQAREAAEKANAMKLQFLGMISHELRTPLTSIKGFTSSLLAEDVTFPREQEREFLAIVDEEADRLTGLVEQLLDLSRLQAGTFRIAIAPQPLNDTLHHAMSQMQALTRQHPLTIEVPHDLPPVLADVERIAQVLVNLVANAVKFSPEQTPVVIRAQRQNGAVRIDVSDLGSGILPHEREIVFEAFRQSERKNPSQRLGVGLGLAICKAIVEAHGGRIWMEDNMPRGTRASFTLPAAEVS